MPFRPPQPTTLALSLALAFPLAPFSSAHAADTPRELPRVVVEGQRIVPAPTAAGDMGNAELNGRRAAASDSARLLQDVPGVSLSGAGGVSSLPVIHGLADDRNRIKVDGMDLISACGNHMNPPLSYIDPSRIENIKVYTGITPVSVGGDSIGGAIVVESKAPRFAQPGAGLITAGELGAFYRSNGGARGANLSATIATEALSLNFSSATAEADNYQAARAFKPGTVATWTRTGSRWVAGDSVASSAYKTTNHSLGLAWRNDNHLLELKVGLQHIPYQGFPNQHMDMTDNRSTQLNLGYQGRFGWGTLNARLYDERTRHQMDFAEDKLYWYGAARNVAGMPMDTRGRNTGAMVKADFALSDRDLLRAGIDIQRYRLDDWWMPVANSMMMSPNTFWNLQAGKRDRFDIFAEWEAQWSSRWLSQFGLRSSTVTMDAGNVQGYNTGAGYATDAARFNAASRRKQDHNLDLTALARYTPDAQLTLEGGYARKTRSPSLYERYTWSSNGMAMTMNNWLNDGNGYVGDIDLKPEVAHSLTLTVDLHDVSQRAWGVKFTPYVSFVDNYIDARCLTACAGNRFNYLKLVNRDARLHGFDLSGFAALGNLAGMGDFAAKGSLAYVHGKATGGGSEGDAALYNIMPLNARLALEQRIGHWTNTLETQFVAAKERRSEVRNEMRTGGYGLVHLRGSYETRDYRIDLGVENLFNRFYAHPLGGAYIGQGTTMSLNGIGAPYGIPIPGMGRTFSVGVNLKF